MILDDFDEFPSVQEVREVGMLMEVRMFVQTCQNNEVRRNP